MVHALIVAGEPQPRVQQPPFAPAGPGQQAVIELHRPQRVEHLLRLYRGIDRGNHGRAEIAGLNVPGEAVAQWVQAVGNHQVPVKLRLNFGVALAAGLDFPLHIPVTGCIQGKVTNHSQEIRQHLRRLSSRLPGPRRTGEKVRPGSVVGVIAHGIHRIVPHGHVIKQNIRPVLSNGKQRPVRLGILAQLRRHRPPHTISKMMMGIVRRHGSNSAFPALFVL